jgi:hypothetical protein
MGIEDFGHVWFGFCDEFLQLGHLAHLLERKDFILLVSIDCKAGRVISSIFQT